jgi:hypothetical protein
MMHRKCSKRNSLPTSPTPSPVTNFTSFLVLLPPLSSPISCLFLLVKPGFYLNCLSLVNNLTICGTGSVIITELEDAYRKEGISHDEESFLHSLLSKARRLADLNICNFLFHSFDTPFSENLRNVGILLSSFSEQQDPTGVILFQTDHLLPCAPSIYVLLPSLTHLLLSSGLAFCIYIPVGPTRLCYMNGLHKVNKSHLSKVFLVITVTLGCVQQYPELSPLSPLRTGQSLHLPMIHPLPLTAGLSHSDEEDSGLVEDSSPVSSDVESLNTPSSKELIIYYYLDPADTVARDLTLEGIKALCNVHGRRFSREQKLLDVSLGITFSHFVLTTAPSDEALRLFLTKVPHVWVKPLDNSLCGSLTVMHFRSSCGSTYFTQISDGLRCLPSSRYLFPDGHGSLVLGPLDDYTLSGLVTSLRESATVDYYIHKGDLIIGNDLYASDLHAYLFPVPVTTTVVVTGLTTDVDRNTIRDLILEVNGDPTSAFWVQDKNDRPGVRFKIGGKYSIHGVKFHTRKACHFHYACVSDFSTLGAPCFPPIVADSMAGPEQKARNLTDAMNSLGLSQNISTRSVKWDPRLTPYTKFLQLHGARDPDGTDHLGSIPYQPSSDPASPTSMDSLVHCIDSGPLSLTTLSVPTVPPALSAHLPQTLDHCHMMSDESDGPPGSTLSSTVSLDAGSQAISSILPLTVALRPAARCAISLCKSPPGQFSQCPHMGCIAILCSHHLVHRTSCPHNLCALCPSLAFSTCNGKKTCCHLLLCPAHKKSPCPGHSLSSKITCSLPGCGEKFHAICHSKGCNLRLCFIHFNEDCPHNTDNPGSPRPHKRRAFPSPDTDANMDSVGLTTSGP